MKRLPKATKQQLVEAITECIWDQPDGAADYADVMLILFRQGLQVDLCAAWALVESGRVKMTSNGYVMCH